MNRTILYIVAGLFLSTTIPTQAQKDPKDNYQIGSFAYTPDGKILILGCYNGLLQIRDSNGILKRGIEINEAHVYGNCGTAIDKVVVSPNGKNILAYTNCTLYILDINGKKVGSFQVGEDVTTLCYSNNGDSIMHVSQKFDRLIYSKDGKKISYFNFSPKLDLPKNIVYYPKLYGSSLTNNGNFIAAYSKAINKKGHLEFYLSEYNKSDSLIRNIKLDVPPTDSKLVFSYNSDINIALIHVSKTVPTGISGFIYDAKTGQLKNLFGLEGYNEVILNSKGDGLIGINSQSISFLDLNGQLLDKYDGIPYASRYSNELIFSDDFQKMIFSNPPALPVMYGQKMETLLTFDYPDKSRIDNSKTVEDKYTYEPSKQQPIVSSAQTTTKPNEISSNQPAITLTNTRSKFDLSGLAAIAKIVYPKTLETKLTGCLAGDCFDGFGYYIKNETEEYCGYFVNGVKSFGQLHRPDEILIYNGYFENEYPNGYGNINYYVNSLIVLGTFKNTQQDGEFTSYKYGDMKNGLSKGGQLTDITLKTGCLSGDCKTGNGVYQLEDGTRFIGGFNTSGMVKGVWFENKARVVKFEGVNSSNQFCGITDIFIPKGEVIHGNFLDGKMNGQGIIKTRLMSKTLCVEGTFENGLGTNITVQFRDGRKWIGAQETADVEWATGTGTMTYPDGTTKTGKFKDGEFVSE